MCIECGSYGGVTVGQIVGFLLGVCLLASTVVFVGTCRSTSSGENDGDPELIPVKLECFTGIETQEPPLAKLRHKLFEVGRLAGGLKYNLPDTLPEMVVDQVQHHLVTIEMFLRKLTRILPRVPPAEPDLRMQKALSKAELLCPVIDQLAAALAGLSGATLDEVNTAILHTR